MADLSQYKFLKTVLRNLINKNIMPVGGLALVSGAALSGHSLAIKSLLESFGYDVMTTDIEAALGVDLVWNLQDPPPFQIEGRINLFVSTSVLEHVANVAVASRNILSALNTNSLLYLSVPWVWRYHRYPDDYHRFHASSLNNLFPSTRSLTRCWSTSPDSKLYTYDENIDAKLSKTIDGVKYLPYLMLHDIRLHS